MRLKLRLSAAAGLVSALLASPSAAQGPEGSRILSDKQAAQELAIYTRCVVSRRERTARALALAPYGSAEQSRLMDAVTRSIDDDCIQGGFDNVRITIRPDVLAGAIAARLLAQDFPNLPSVVDKSTADVEAERARAAQVGVAERFGRCIVWSDPAGVQALLRAEPATDAERQAIAGLQHDMGMCVEEGSTLRLDRTFVRNVAAVSAYRLAHQLRSLGAETERG